MANPRQREALSLSLPCFERCIETLEHMAAAVSGGKPQGGNAIISVAEAAAALPNRCCGAGPINPDTGKSVWAMPPGTVAAVSAPDGGPSGYICTDSGRMLVQEVYSYWAERRSKLRKPLLRRCVRACARVSCGLDVQTVVSLRHQHRDHHHRTHSSHHDHHSP